MQKNGFTNGGSLQRNGIAAILKSVFLATPYSWLTPWRGTHISLFFNVMASGGLGGLVWYSDPHCIWYLDHHCIWVCVIFKVTFISDPQVQRKWEEGRQEIIIRRETTAALLGKEVVRAETLISWWGLPTFFSARNLQGCWAEHAAGISFSLDIHIPVDV